MASNSSKRIYTVCGVSLAACGLIENKFKTPEAKKVTDKAKITTMRVFAQQKDPLTKKEARGIRDSIKSRFEKGVDFNVGGYLLEELEDIASKVKGTKKPAVMEMVEAIKELVLYISDQKETDENIPVPVTEKPTEDKDDIQPTNVVSPD